MVPRLFTLERMRAETADTFTMELAPTDDGPEFAFQAGQFNMLGIPGVGEAPISISGDPSKRELLVHTTREVGAVTRALSRVGLGETVTIRGPYGRSWPTTEAVGKDIVLVAGGIGLAPLRPVIYEVMASRAQYNRFLILYGTRTPDDILFAKQLSKWRSQFDIELVVTVDRGAADWRGNVGVVTMLIPRAPFSPENTIAMVCGPELMMRYSVRDLEHRGVSSDRIYVSLERNMKCGIGLCGHCQLRGKFVCRDGPVFSYAEIAPLLEVWEL